MFYVTVKQTPKVRQMTLDELLFESSVKPVYINKDISSTYTKSYDKVPYKFQVGKSIEHMVRKIKEFNEKYDALRQCDRKELYHTFYIPKKSGGLRKIDAPNDDLKKALRDLKDIFINDFGALYHTSAFAYIKNRSTIKALQKHQSNKSRWYGKLDLSNFFGSTTLEFTVSMLERIFPFSEILCWDDAREELIKAIELGFLDGGLPQGTPLSPALTNIIMIPIDFEFNKVMRGKEQTFVCTRYADDFLVSSRYDFNVKEVENTLRGIMASFNAPYIIKPEKTRYGSSSGQNWNLGLMINGNNEITVGHKRKREFKAMLTNYILDTKNGKPWELGDVQVMEGLRSYYTSVEGETIEEIIRNIDAKFEVNVKEMIRVQLHGA